MIACVDVDYKETQAVAAGIAFRDWLGESVVEERVVTLPNIQPYQSGQFFICELPCLLAVLRVLPPVQIVLIDGYVWLEKKPPGLGAHLYHSLDRRVPVAPALKPIINLYPDGQNFVNANVMEWRGVSTATQEEHVGLFRLDHRFTEKLSEYFRLSKNSTDIFTPNAALPSGTRNLDAPTSGLFEFLYLVSPRTNELRLGANYSEPLNSITTSGTTTAISVPSLTTIPAETRRIAFGITQSLIDEWSTLRGAHTLKAGWEIRGVQLIVHDWPNAQAGTLTYASLADFQANRLTSAQVSGELSSKQMPKIQYHAYFQDEWKVKSNLTANLGSHAWNT